MRFNTLTTIFSLAIIAGSTFAADAQQRSTPGRGGNNGGGQQVERNDPGAGDSENRRRPCYVVGATSIACPPKKKRMTLKQTREGDCECKTIVMLVGGTRRAVLDCYQTRIVEDVKRTYVCQRPE